MTLSMHWVTVVNLAILALLGGYILGRALEERYWQRKGNPIQRTAVRSRGKLYYVVPDKEYWELHAKIIRLENIEFMD